MSKKCCNENAKARVIINFYRRSMNAKNSNGVYGNELSIRTSPNPYMSMSGYVETKQGYVETNEVIAGRVIANFECNYFPGLESNDIIKIVERSGKTNVFTIDTTQDKNFQNKTWLIKAIYDHTF